MYEKRKRLLVLVCIEVGIGRYTIYTGRYTLQDRRTHPVGGGQDKYNITIYDIIQKLPEIADRLRIFRNENVFRERETNARLQK